MPVDLSGQQKLRIFALGILVGRMVKQGSHGYDASSIIGGTGVLIRID